MISAITKMVGWIGSITSAVLTYTYGFWIWILRRTVHSCLYNKPRWWWWWWWRWTENNLDLGWWHSLRACVFLILAHNSHGNTGNYRFKVWDSCGAPFFVICLQLSARPTSLTGRTKGFCSTISQDLKESAWKLFDEWPHVGRRETQRTIIKHSLITLSSRHSRHNECVSNKVGDTKS